MPPQIDYQNPKKLHLHELTFDAKNDGVVHTIPALSKEWVENRPHIKYLPLKMRNPTDAFIEEWLIKNEWFNGNLEWLIELEHHRFWSNLVFEPGCITSIVSFLQGAIPAYISIKSITTDSRVIELYSKISINVLTALCRMVTCKETEVDWITKENMAKLLYDSFLFSIPMALDLLTVFGRTNAQTIKKLIGNVLKIQPKYQNDLKEGFNFLTNVFATVQEKINENNPDDFEDLALYILDCAYTLNTLINVLPETMSICREIKLEQKVTKFYDDVIPHLHKNIKHIYSDSDALTHINTARIEMISFFRHLANEFLQEALNDSQKRASADKFLDSLQEALSENIFIADYQRLYPVEDDIEWLVNVHPDLDKFKMDFIKQAYTAENENFLETFVDRIETEGATGGASSSSNNAIGESSKPIDPMEKQVQNVLDILPDLQDAFVRKLLTRYENAELAIAAVLEGNLPPDLDSSINIESPMDDKNPTVQIEKSTSVMEALNLDEDTQIASKHIKSQTIKSKAEKRFLNDKSSIKEFHTRNFECGYVYDDEYDDEYDDSFDALTSSESKVKTKFLKKSGAINEMVDEIVEESSEEDDETTDQSQQRDKSRDFCENPEVIRERWARNREAKYGNKRPSKPQSNLVGNAKGQGQDKATLIGRQNKNENKSSRANHNRRQGAAFKRNRGMIPS